MISAWLAAAVLILLQAQGAVNTAEIHGRVLDSETGKPLPRAEVWIWCDDQKFHKTAAADDEGVFKLIDLPAGRCAGLVTPGPYRSTHLWGELRRTSDRRELNISRGEKVRVDVSLPRALGISVRVVDSFGDPLSGVRVSALDTTLKTSWSGWMQHTTDDRGNIRVFGLRPGRYIFCAETGGTWSRGSESALRDRLQRTCYPNVEDDAQAEVVRIDGATTGGIEIRMRRGRTFTIAGRVVDATGSPATGASVGLAEFTVRGGSSGGSLVAPDGSFKLVNVHPGT